MAIKNIDEVEIDSTVRYGFYRLLKYKGVDEAKRHVILEDVYGERQLIYLSLFLQHGVVLAEPAYAYNPNKCLACGEEHTGMAGLPCPSMRAS